MSALTKVFVVLHVIMSMLLTAGLVVFVNRTENFKQAETDLKKARDVAELRANLATAAAQTANSNAAAQVKEAQDRAAATQTQLATANATILDLRTQLAEANSRLATQEATVASANQALQASQANAGALQTQLVEMRQANDRLTKRNTEQDLAISDLTNRHAVAQRQLRNALEELQQEREERERRPIAPAADAGGDQAGATLPPDRDLDGVIRETRRIAGRDYATISLGSADAVERGMRFSVVDRRTGDFLGYLHVDSVEPNESTGRLEGPRVGDVRPGHVVRTRL